MRRDDVTGSGGGAALVPKLIGADIELGNFILGLERPGGTGDEAAWLLLREIEGVPGLRRNASGSAAGWRGRSYGDGGHGDGGSERAVETASDWGRRFLDNGGCAYIDQGHCELAAPEVRSAFDHVASWHAMLRIAQGGLRAANRRLEAGLRLQALVNNSDGRGNSYGSHLSFLVSRRAFDGLFERRLHHLLWLASFQVSSVVWSGQGKVGSENGAEPVDFQLAQRADFFERLVGPQTTWARPLVNRRDEALCGPWGGRAASRYARLHVIFFDNALMPVACLLRAGTTQIVLAMIEAGVVDAGLLLEDPLEAVRAFSHDPTLAARARTCDGRLHSAIELQRRFHERAQAFHRRHGLEGVVPRASEILAIWGHTLDLLERGDRDALARRLDWALKLSLLERARVARAGATWDDPALRHLDQLYGSLAPDEGLYWGFASAGLVERVVSDEEVRRFTLGPPADTRAWSRAMLLERAGAERIESVDWDTIRLWTRRGSLGSGLRTVDLPDPLGHGESAAGPAFERPLDLDGLLDELETTCDATLIEERRAT
jgi:proteasome accessory factor A